MCFDCILVKWSNTNEFEKAIKLFPRKHRVRIVNNYDDDKIFNVVMDSFLYDHLLMNFQDLEIDDICNCWDNPDFVYYDFKSSKYYNMFLKILWEKDYAYLGKHKYSFK